MNLRSKLATSYTWHILTLDIMKSLKKDILDKKRIIYQLPNWKIDDSKIFK